jgi:hypothetical protein
VLRRLLDFLRGRPDAPGAAPPPAPHAPEQGPVVPVAPPTSGPAPAMELETDEVDPARE